MIHIQGQAKYATTFPVQILMPTKTQNNDREENIPQKWTRLKIQQYVEWDRRVLRIINKLLFSYQNLLVIRKSIVQL